MPKQFANRSSSATLDILQILVTLILASYKDKYTCYQIDGMPCKLMRTLQLLKKSDLLLKKLSLFIPTQLLISLNDNNTPIVNSDKLQLILVRKKYLEGNNIKFAISIYQVNI